MLGVDLLYVVHTSFYLFPFDTFIKMIEEIKTKENTLKYVPIAFVTVVSEYKFHLFHLNQLKKHKFAWLIWNLENNTNKTYFWKYETIDFGYDIVKKYYFKDGFDIDITPKFILKNEIHDEYQEMEKILIKTYII